MLQQFQYGLRRILGISLRTNLWYQADPLDTIQEVDVLVFHMCNATLYIVDKRMIGADYVLSPSLQLRDGALAHNEQSFRHVLVYRKQLTSIAGHAHELNSWKAS